MTNNSLELELQTIVRCHETAGNKPGSSTRPRVL